MSRQTPPQAGFTLIEIIATLLVVAVVGVMVAQFFGTSFTSSTTPVTQLQTAFGLQQVMEEMTEEYLDMAASDDSMTKEELATLQTDIGGANVYGDGAYVVVANDFVAFDAGNNLVADADGNNDIMRVTIRHADTGETLTTLFTTR